VVAALVALLGVVAFAPQLNEGDAIGRIALVDQDGRAFSFDRLHGRAVVVSFVYTRCTDSCALVAAKLAQLARAADPRKVAVVALTVDPGYDRPPVLLRYRHEFGASQRWTLATGAPAALVFLERRFGAQAQQRGTSVEHADLAVVLDPRGRIARLVRGDDWTPQQLDELAEAAAGRAQDPLLALQLWLGDAAARCGEAVSSLSTGTELTLVAALSLLIGVPLVRGALHDRAG